MSVHLNPNNALGFNRPFTQIVKRILTISNKNEQPVAFKVKTTAPKLYCVRPNSGRIGPGGSVEVTVMLQPMLEDPPLSAKCKDKFLIQSTLITPEKETRDLQDIWNAQNNTGEAWRVHQQKLRVVYLPTEGHIPEEDDEIPQEGPVAVLPDISFQYEPREADIPPLMPPVPAVPPMPPVPPMLPMPANGAPSTSAAPQWPQPPPAMASPVRHEMTFLDSQEHRLATNGVVVNVRTSPPPTAPVLVNTVDTEEMHHLDVQRILEVRLTEAQSEIQRLRALLVAVPDPSSTAPESVAPGSVLPESVVSESVAPYKLRRRSGSSDDDSISQYTDAVLHHAVIHHDGVPLQVVIIIALGVFITTYLFF